jgi:hypothetical protein
MPSFPIRTASLATLFCALLTSPARAAEKPSPPAAPATGFGSSAAPFPEVVEQTLRNPVMPARLVHVFRPVFDAKASGAAIPDRLPVVAFAHGFGANDARPYEAWLRHVASQGAYVVYPVYPAIEAPTGTSRYDVLWAGLEAALRSLAAGEGPAPDLSRIGFLGHSYGGGAAPALAARAAARGWGSKALWVECYAPYYDFDREAWTHLPAHACLLVVVFEDDAMVDPAIGAAFLPAAATVPPERKAMLCFHPDSHGEPPLRADHFTPLARTGADAFDHRGVWRLDDALRSFAITGSPDARSRCLGADEATTAIGEWSDGIAVAPLTLGAPTNFRLRMWVGGGPAERFARRFLAAEAHSTLPLPPPATVRASRLPASERIAHDVPAGPWPEDVERATREGPALVVVRRAGSAAGEAVAATVAARAAALRERGATALVLPADGPLADRLGLSGDVTTLAFAKGGEVLLWRDGVDRNLVDAALDLFGPK